MLVFTTFIILLLFGIISLVLNLFLLLIFIKGFSSLRKLPYFFYCFQILICALMSIVVKFAYVIPHSANSELRLSDLYITIMALIESIAYHGELFFIFALAFHRLMFFISIKLVSKISFVISMVLFIWCMVFLFVGCQCYFECFDTAVSPDSVENGIWNGVQFYSMCDTDTLGQVIFKVVTAIVNDYLPACTLLFYALLLFKIRYDVVHLFKHLQFKRLTEVHSQRNDLGILYQAITIYACFFIKFRILNTIGYGSDETSLNGILKLLIYVTIYGRTMTQPIFLLCFNKTIQTLAKEIIFYKRRQKQAITPAF